MCTRKPTLTEFVKFSKDVAPAARAVLMARVYLEMERQRVDAYIQPIFESFGFTYGAIAKDQHTGPIPTPRDLYLADDGPKMQACHEACDQAHRAHGFKGPQGHCPALIAERYSGRPKAPSLTLRHRCLALQPSLVWRGPHRYLELLIGAALKEGQTS